MQAKMKWRQVIISLSFPFRSKDKLNCFGRIWCLMELGKNSHEIQFRVDRGVIDRNHVGTHELATKSMQLLTNGRMTNFGDKDTVHVTASVKIKTKRRERSKIQGNGDHLELGEGSSRDVKIGEMNIIKLNNI
jgi:hypothetical protein